ncbi:MAG: hypothetical protein Q8L34_05385 [Candidatus Woesearchaeota archaeon]|nr:hypothetical protein [Candidatus Woesearchaeota archaeon]
MGPSTKFTTKASETLDGSPLTYYEVDQIPWYMRGIVSSANITGERTQRIPSPLLNGVSLKTTDQCLVVVGDGMNFFNVYLVDDLKYLGRDPSTKLWKLFDYAHLRQLRGKNPRSSSLQHSDPPIFSRIFMTEFPSHPLAQRETVAYRFLCNDSERVCLVHNRSGSSPCLVHNRSGSSPETLDIHFLTPSTATDETLILRLHREGSFQPWTTPSLDTLLVTTPSIATP